MGHNIYYRVTICLSITANRLYLALWSPTASSACPASRPALAWCTGLHCCCSVHVLKAVGKLLLTPSGPL
jgi:hypothetical protein